jgi:hypothetical protein
MDDHRRFAAFLTDGLERGVDAGADGQVTGQQGAGAMHKQPLGPEGGQILEADTEAEDVMKALKVVADARTVLTEEQGLGPDPAKPPLHSLPHGKIPAMTVPLASYEKTEPIRVS